MMRKGLGQANLFLCGDVEVALEEVKEKVLVDLLSYGVTRHLAVHIWLFGQMYLCRKQKVNIRHKDRVVLP